jgi:hypothetical protein
MSKDFGKPPLPIGGWLVVVAIRMIGGMLQNLSTVFTLGDLPESFVKTLLILYLVVFYAVSVGALSLFFRRHKGFRYSYIMLEAFNILFCLVFSFCSALHAPTFIAAAIPSAIFLVYITQSQRARLTFVFDGEGNAEIPGDDEYAAEINNDTLPPEDGSAGQPSAAASATFQAYAPAPQQYAAQAYAPTPPAQPQYTQAKTPLYKKPWFYIALAAAALSVAAVVVALSGASLQAQNALNEELLLMHASASPSAQSGAAMTPADFLQSFNSGADAAQNGWQLDQAVDLSNSENEAIVYADLKRLGLETPKDGSVFMLPFADTTQDVIWGCTDKNGAVCSMYYCGKMDKTDDTGRQLCEYFISAADPSVTQTQLEGLKIDYGYRLFKPGDVEFSARIEITGTANQYIVTAQFPEGYTLPAAASPQPSQTTGAQTANALTPDALRESFNSFNYIKASGCMLGELVTVDSTYESYNTFVDSLEDYGLKIAEGETIFAGRSGTDGLMFLGLMDASEHITAVVYIGKIGQLDWQLCEAFIRAAQPTIDESKLEEMTIGDTPATYTIDGIEYSTCIERYTGDTSAYIVTAKFPGYFQIPANPQAKPTVSPTGSAYQL